MRMSQVVDALYDNGEFVPDEVLVKTLNRIANEVKEHILKTEDTLTDRCDIAADIVIEKLHGLSIEANIVNGGVSMDDRMEGHRWVVAYDDDFNEYIVDPTISQFGDTNMVVFYNDEDLMRYSSDDS